jgi:hypothetical protein
VFKIELERDPNLKYYTILPIYSGSGDADVKTEIRLAYENADPRGGLIVLAYRMLTRAVSLPDLDSVFLLNNTRSPDLYIQSIFRPMSERSQKVHGYVFDAYENRVLETIGSFAGLTDEMSPEEQASKVTHILANCITLDNGLLTMTRMDELIGEILHAYHDMAVKINYILLHPSIVDNLDDIPPECEILINAARDAIQSPTAGEIRINKDADELLDELQSGLQAEEEEEYELPRRKALSSSNASTKLQSKSRDVELSRLISLIVLLTNNTADPAEVNLLNLTRQVANDPALSHLFQEIMTSRSPELGNRNAIDLMLKLVTSTNMSQLDTVNVLVSKLRDRLDGVDQVATAEEYHAIFMEFLGKPASMEVKAHGEVYTPLSLVTEMLDKLPAHVWSNPALKWFEPACGLAPFLYMAYHRLLSGLEAVIPDEAERTRHILEKMFYFNEIQPKNIELFKLLFNARSYRLNIFEGDGLSVVPPTFRADIVMMNPPYNSDQSNGTTSTKTIYQLFVQRYFDAPHLLAITPSRWFNGGKNLDGFRKLMLSRRDIKVLVHKEAAGEWFPSISLMGGINYFYKDSGYDGLCNYNGNYRDLTLNDNLSIREDDDILKKKLSLLELPSLSTIITGRAYYNIETNDGRLQPLGSIRCYVSTFKSQDRILYLPADFIILPEKVHWKVVTVHANGAKNGGFGFMTVAAPMDVYSGSYLAFKTDTEFEARSLISYLQTKVVHTILLMYKTTQHINAKILKYVPLVPLDRIWTEETVVEYLALDITTSTVSQQPPSSTDKCRALTTKGTQCTRKCTESGYCKQHEKSSSAASSSAASSSAASSSAASSSAASSSASASIDCQRLENSVGKKGYTVEQLKSYARERGLVFKASATKDILRELLLASC